MVGYPPNARPDQKVPKPVDKCRVNRSMPVMSLFRRASLEAAMERWPLNLLQFGPGRDMTGRARTVSAV